MTLNENFIDQLKLLPKQEKLIVIKILLDTQNAAESAHKVTELAGLGKEIWQNEDAQSYVNKERSSWN